MGNIWLILAAPAAVLAAVVFFKVFDVQEARVSEIQVKNEAQTARMEADWKEAFNGKRDAAADARAESAQAKVEKVEKEAEDRRKAAIEAGKAQGAELEKLLTAGTTSNTANK